KNDSIFYISFTGGGKSQQILLSGLAGDLGRQRPQVFVPSHQVHLPSARSGQHLQRVDRQLPALRRVQHVEGRVLHADRIDRHRNLLQKFRHLHRGELACVVHAVREQQDGPLVVAALEHLARRGGDRVEERRLAGGLQIPQRPQELAWIRGEVLHEANLALRKDEQREVVSGPAILDQASNGVLGIFELARHAHAAGGVEEESEGNRRGLVLLEGVELDPRLL